MRIDFYPFVTPYMVVTLALLLLAGVGISIRVLQLRRVPQLWRTILGILRLLAVALLVLMLLRPVVRLSRERPAKADRLVLIDTSLSMSQRDTQVGVSRLQQVMQRVGDKAWQRQQLADTTLHWFAFDAHVRPVEAGEAERLQADGAETDFATALEEALMIYQWGLDDARTERVRPRVLLLSDGADRGRSDPRSVAERLGIAVDFIAPETSAPLVEPYMEISDVQHNRRVLLGSEFRMQVTVRQEGCSGKKATLVLAEEGERLIAQPLNFTAEREEQQLMLQFAPGRAGVQRYTLQLEGNGGGEIAALNNTTGRVVTVRVESQFHDILYIESAWRWSFPFLRRVIEDDPAFAFSAFLTRGGGVFVQFAESKRRVNLTGFPRSLAELEGFDTLILGDVVPAELPPGLAAALPAFVAERGKSLVVVAGPRIGSWLRYPDLAALLPIEVTPGGGLIEGPIPVRIGDEARQSAFFFAPEDGASLLQWRELPEMDQLYAPQRKKPAATVLLESPAKRNAYGPLIVAATHSVGRGEVLYLATDTLWKWQMLGQLDEAENTPFNLFWRQALRAIRPDRLTGEGVDLWLHPERTRIEQGDEITVYARLDGAPQQQIQLQGRQQTAGVAQQPIAFTPQPDAPGNYRALFSATRPGVYEIIAEVTGGGEVLGSTATEVEVLPRPPESASGPVELLQLERLAAATGGRNLALEESGRQAEKQSRGQPLERETLIWDLWSNLALLLILAVVLGCDWLLRLIRGFV